MVISHFIALDAIDALVESLLGFTCTAHCESEAVALVSELAMPATPAGIWLNEIRKCDLQRHFRFAQLFQSCLGPRQVVDIHLTKTIGAAVQDIRNNRLLLNYRWPVQCRVQRRFHGNPSMAVSSKQG